MNENNVVIKALRAGKDKSDPYTDLYIYGLESDGKPVHLNLENTKLDEVEFQKLIRTIINEFVKTKQENGISLEDLRKSNLKIYSANNQANRDFLNNEFEEALKVYNEKQNLSVKKEEKEFADEQDNEEKSNFAKGVVAGGLAVATLGGLGYAAMQHKNNQAVEQEMSTSTEGNVASLEGQDWDYYINNAADTTQKRTMTNIYNTLNSMNNSKDWMMFSTEDQTAIWGITPEQALSMYTYYNTLSSEELMSIYGGAEINPATIEEESNRGTIAMFYYYANIKEANSGIANLFNDQQSKDLIQKFEEIQVRYNNAQNDSERTAIAKEKKQMYIDSFIENASGSYVDVSSVPGAKFIIDSMFPSDFVRYRGSSADLGNIADILIQDDKNPELQSKSDSACSAMKLDLEQYTEFYNTVINEYNTLKTVSFYSKEVDLSETTYSQMTKGTFAYTQVLDLMTNSLKLSNKYPAFIDLFNMTIEGEKKLIPVSGNSNTSSSRYSGGHASSGGTTQGTTTITTAATREEALKQGATEQQLNEVDKKFEEENKKAKENAEERAKELGVDAQKVYDQTFNYYADGGTGEYNSEWAKSDAEHIRNAYARGKEDGKKAYRASQKEEKEVGGKITNEGSQMNSNGVTINDPTITGGKTETIPWHNPADQSNPYNQPSVSDQAKDNQGNLDVPKAGEKDGDGNVIKADDTIVVDPVENKFIPTQPSSNNNTQTSTEAVVNTTTTSSTVTTTAASESISKESTLSYGVTSSTEGGEVTYNSEYSDYIIGGTLTTDGSGLDNIFDSSNEVEISGDITAASIDQSYDDSLDAFINENDETVKVR